MASPAMSAELPADAIPVGRVRGAWGVRGWLRVTPFNDPHESLLPSQRQWWLRTAGAVRALEITSARPHGDDIVAKAAGIEDRDAAAALEGCEILIRRADFPRPSDDEYYWVDLIGCTVRNPAGETLGVVSAIENHAAHAVLRLSDTLPTGARAAPDRLIPLVPAFILAIDVEARSIVADWARDY